MATTTSDIVKMPTRPGNSNWETLKKIIKQGNKITMDQKAAVGKAAFIIVKSGRGSTWKTPENIAEIAVVEINTKVANGKMGIFDHRFSVAIPIAQKIPDKKLYRSPMLSGYSADSPSDDNSKNYPKNPAPIDIIRALVNCSDSQITPIKVDQTSVK